jgi:tetrahydrodipicolinate N-succinyltransferase
VGGIESEVIVADLKKAGHGKKYDVAVDVSGGEMPTERAPVQIDIRCFIWLNMIVGKGVQIGGSCVIATYSFIKKNNLSGMKVVGNQVRITDYI